MKCVLCGSSSNKVIDTEKTKNNQIRRRRECINCGIRWSTYEVSEVDIKNIKDKFELAFKNIRV